MPQESSKLHIWVGMDDNLATRLREVQDMICLLHHRNKNQHRQAKWWKWLSMLKRCTEKLIRDLESSDSVRSTARILYMEEFLCRRCYVSFTQIIEDNQFSSLGIVVVAQLAKIQTLIGSISCYGQKETLTALPASACDSNFELQIEDLGVAVERISSVPVDFNDSETKPASVVDESLTTNGASENGNPAKSEWRGIEHRSLRVESSTTKPSEKTGTDLRVQSSPARRKMQKATNAIDDIFQSLL